MNSIANGDMEKALEERGYVMESINSANILTSPLYQRVFDEKKVKHIVDDFDERIANEPKLSFRDGNYYVFDGQHTIAARKEKNRGKDLNIICKVFYDIKKRISGSLDIVFMQKVVDGMALEKDGSIIITLINRAQIKGRK